jgi:hypothetical protein
MQIMGSPVALRWSSHMNLHSTRSGAKSTRGTGRSVLPSRRRNVLSWKRKGAFEKRVGPLNAGSTNLALGHSMPLCHCHCHCHCHVADPLAQPSPTLHTTAPAALPLPHCSDLLLPATAMPWSPVTQALFDFIGYGEEVEPPFNGAIVWFSPNSPFLNFWEFTSALLILYSTIITPFLISFWTEEMGHCGYAPTIKVRIL